MEHMQARHRLKQHHRARLGHLGLGFCDDNAARLQQLELLYADARGIWEAESTLYETVTASACHASTTDNEVQTKETTLRNDRLFWSSTGSQTQIADEALLYELCGPACQVHFLKLAVYRAFYQHGYPVYPPMQLQIWTGPSPSQLQPASPVYDVQATDALQTFAVDPEAPVARYLQVRMYGKLQKQREDMQFYVAIRYISAVGTVIPASQLSSLKSVINAGHWVLNPGGQLPGNCCAGLSNVTRWGLGPADAAQGVVAAGRILDLPQQQRQQGVVEHDKLIVRQQQQQQQLSNVKDRNQQLRQRRQGQDHNSDAGGSSGFWSSLGFSRWRGQKAADASAAGCDCIDSSCKTDSMQIDSNATAAGTSSAADAVRDQQQIEPKWLLPDNASHLTIGSSSSQHCTGPGSLTDLSGYSSDGSDPYESDGDASDDDADDHDPESDQSHGADAAGAADVDGGRRGWAAVADIAGAAEQARMELLLWQALNRLPDPNDPVDREQLLAVWLEDAPLNSNIPSPLRQQVAVATAGPGSSSSGDDRQQQQLLPGGWIVRPRPVVVCQDGTSSSSKSSSSSSEQLGEYPGGSRGLDPELSVSCQADLSACLVLQHAALAQLMQLSPAAAAAEAAAAALARGIQQPAAAAAGGAAGESEIEVLQQPDQQIDAVRVSGRCLFGVNASGASSSSRGRVDNNDSGWTESCSLFDEGLEQDLYLHQQLLAA